MSSKLSLSNCMKYTILTLIITSLALALGHGIGDAQERYQAGQCQKWERHAGELMGHYLTEEQKEVCKHYSLTK